MDQCSLERLFLISNPAGWKGSKDTLDSNLLILVHSGSMLVDCSLGQIEVGPREVICLPEGDSRQARCDIRTESLRLRWKGPHPVRAHGIISPSPLSILESLALLHKRRDLSPETSHHLLSALSNFFDGRLTEPKENHHSRATHHDFQPWMDLAIEGKSNVTQGARTMGLHPDHFTRLFKSQFGSSPKNWLMESRFNLACQWIEEDGLGASELVRAFGLKDASLFCRQFRRRFGCSPGSWKRRHAKC